MNKFSLRIIKCSLWDKMGFLLFKDILTFCGKIGRLTKNCQLSLTKLKVKLGFPILLLFWHRLALFMPEALTIKIKLNNLKLEIEQMYTSIFFYKNSHYRKDFDTLKYKNRKHINIAFCRFLRNGIRIYQMGKRPWPTK